MTSSLTQASSPPRLWALIPAAGSGSRAGSGPPKQHRLLAGQPLMAHTLAAFAGVPELAGVLVVLAPSDTMPVALPSATFSIAACGGATRATSVFNGLQALRQRGADEHDWVLVHDAARCLVTPRLIRALVAACRNDAVGGLLAVPLPDTLKRADASGRVAVTLPRDGCWLAQTPQMFRIGALQSALESGIANPAVTDEASAMEAQGHRPLLVPGSAENFKITVESDFALAQTLLLNRNTMNIRIGEGWDIHALVPDRALVLGGVTIPYERGLLGHSDADALLHAITDAVLGAAGLGDIGRHFPDTDAAFAGADSMQLLRQAVELVHGKGWQIANVDSTIVAQAPKLAGHIPAMRQRIAMALGLVADQVNVKAKTAERMGPVGAGEAIEARAVVLLVADPR